MNTYEIENETFYELIILIFNNCTRVVNELNPFISMILVDSPQIRYRIYPTHHIKAGIKRENLSFLDICLRSEVVYIGSESSFRLRFPKLDLKRTLVIAKLGFDEEIGKIQIFKDGADFYLMKENYCHAAFMVHQVIELSYRCIELSIMGKDKITHSIRYLQNQIRSFIPQLGDLFEENNEEENDLLSVLDDAYIAVRYGDKYEINKEQLTVLFEKAKRAQEITISTHEEFCSAFEQKHVKRYK